MRKIILLLLTAVILSGCNNASVDENSAAVPQSQRKTMSAGSDGVIEISERMFIQRCADIFNNPEDYKDKIIRIEGMYTNYLDGDGASYNCVYRNTPGCCGDDGMAGFEFNYDGEMPAENDWIEVEGTLYVKSTGPVSNEIRIIASKLTIKEERGEEFVNY